MVLILWLNEHRILVVAVMGATMWIGAYSWYFRSQLRGWFRRGKPHSWSVNMVTKKTVVRGKEQF